MRFLSLITNNTMLRNTLSNVQVCCFQEEDDEVDVDEENVKTDIKDTETHR
jgi:hypothetical protein